MSSERIPARPKPASYRPAYIQQTKLDNVTTITEDGNAVTWWQTRPFKALIILSSMMGFVVSSACLFATLLIDPKLTTNFEGEVGLFFQNMYQLYGTKGVLLFWGISLVYFFITAYRNAVKF